MDSVLATAPMSPCVSSCRADRRLPATGMCGVLSPELREQFRVR